MEWNLLDKVKRQLPKLKSEEILDVLLDNRGLKTEKEKLEFLNPKNPEEFTAGDLGIDNKEILKAVKRIKKAVDNNQSIIVYGDYDADGICATAILWETLYGLSKNVLPYIPERVSEGYGLNTESIKNLKLKNKNLGLIITVDHGITAAEKIEYAKSLGIDIIICDHHQPPKELPKCEAIVHTDKICAAAISWFLAKEILETIDDRLQTPVEDIGLKAGSCLDLVAIASIADLEPLVGINRSFVKYGLEALNKTKRCGILAIIEEAGLELGSLGTYEVGYIIAPRLNAMGRMEHALESLRLICTKNCQKAKELAEKLGVTNKERQLLTENTLKHVLENSKGNNQLSKIIFVSHETYNQGIIGLVAGKLVEEYYRPAIVVSLGEVYSKASARSISGFNIIEAIRAQSDLLIDAGGHPMAAGFTIETAKIPELRKRLYDFAEKAISEETLKKSLKIDLQIPLSFVSLPFFEEISKLSPFGLGNYEPVFASEAIIEDFRLVGNEGKHLKLRLKDGKRMVGAIAFNQGQLCKDLKTGDKVKIAFTLSVNEWSGEKVVELKVKDILLE